MRNSWRVRIKNLDVLVAISAEEIRFGSMITRSLIPVTLYYTTGLKIFNALEAHAARI